jgi:hypothetical protein
MVRGRGFEPLKAYAPDRWLYATGCLILAQGKF